MLKICLITHSMRLDTGTGVFAQRLCESIRRNGHEVTALTAEAGGVVYERAVLRPDRFHLLGSLSEIRAAIRESDIVHVFDAYPYGILAAFAGVGLNKPLIISAIATGSVLKLDHLISGFFMRFAYRQAGAVVAISEFTRKEILKRVPRLSIRVAHLGVDFERFEKARALRAVPAPFPYILGVGALRYRKGYDTSIAAFAKIKDEFPDLSYVIVGKRHSQEYFEHLKKLSADLGVGKQVIFRDNVDSETEMQRLYGQARIFLVTSQNDHNDFEGFGLVFLEAAAAGLPIVATNESGIEEATSRENSILVRPGDSAAAAAALTKILSDEALQKRMGKASLAHARAFSWESKIAAYDSLYKEFSGKTTRAA